MSLNFANGTYTIHKNYPTGLSGNTEWNTDVTDNEKNVAFDILFWIDKGPWSNKSETEKLQAIESFFVVQSKLNTATGKPDRLTVTGKPLKDFVISYYQDYKDTL